MAETALGLVRRVVENWNAGNLEAAAEHMDEHVVIRPDAGLRVFEGVAVGRAAGIRFMRNMQETMGLGRLTLLSEEDHGAWCTARVRQDIHSASGIESSWEWSLVTTARNGKIVLQEFFVDEATASAALGRGS